jgi:hypothetical protein
VERESRRPYEALDLAVIGRRNGTLEVSRESERCTILRACTLVGVTPDLAFHAVIGPDDHAKVGGQSRRRRLLCKDRYNRTRAKRERSQYIAPAIVKSLKTPSPQS